MTEKNNNRKSHYAWKIFASCILLKIGLGGIVMCIAGNFITPVVMELGCEVNQFTMLISVEAAAMALMYTTAARMFETKKIGTLMGIAAIAEVFGIALMSTYRSVFMFYISGAIIGVGVAFTGFVAVPLLVNMWFRKNAGTVLGIIMATEGLAVVLYTKLSAVLIAGIGWRNAYLVLAIVSLLLSVPALFLLVKSPSEAGCQPYGAEEGEESGGELRSYSNQVGFTKKQAVRMPLFYIIWAICMLFSVGTGVQQYFSTFSTMELGESIAFGANAAMLMSLGCVVSSIILGFVNDRFGVKAGLGWGAFFITIGYVLMIYSIRHHQYTALASLLVGFGGSMYTVQCPLVVRTILGTKEYSSIWALMMMGNSMVGAFSFGPIGLFYDRTGSYKGAFIMVIALYCLAFFIGVFAVNYGKKITKIST